MTFCKNCGVAMNDDALYCQNCGKPTKINKCGVVRGSGKAKTSNIVLSVLSIAGLFIGNAVSFILGIVAMILTVLAAGATTADEEESKNKSAKVISIVGVVLNVLAVILTIVFGVLLAGSLAILISELIKSGAFKDINFDPSQWSSVPSM